MASAWQQHRQKWLNCTECPLCEQRTKVVLARGSIPADVLFIGEAPGASEGVLGQPFVGPAGQLLDQIVARAIEHSGKSPSVCFTNLVACIPKGDDGHKVKEPPEESIKACSSRLDEMFQLVKPKLAICVGKLAGKWIPTLWGYSSYDKFIEITHPAAILRADVVKQPLMIQSCQVALADAFAELD